MKLNQALKGRPLIWFHAGLGGIEAYLNIAQEIKRPFYGIRARGYMENKHPLVGIQAMCSYYVLCIQSVQPHGPYDLGGYSLGGILAYEVTRQLQKLGETVNTIVMLDSLHPETTKLIKEPQKSKMLQIMNAIIMTLDTDVSNFDLKKLIHRDEVNFNLEKSEFIHQLISLAKMRGVTQMETQLEKQLQQNIKIQNNYEINQYSILPLLNPKAVTCYYFRNKSGLFFGNLEPYFSMQGNGFTVLDNMNYWQGWKKQLPHFYMSDVDSTNHMMLLSEPKAFKKITKFCVELYSKKKISLKLFK